MVSEYKNSIYKMNIRDLSLLGEICHSIIHINNTFLKKILILNFQFKLSFIIY